MLPLFHLPTSVVSSVLCENISPKDLCRFDVAVSCNKLLLKQLDEFRNKPFFKFRGLVHVKHKALCLWDSWNPFYCSTSEKYLRWIVKRKYKPMHLFLDKNSIKNTELGLVDMSEVQELHTNNVTLSDALQATGWPVKLCKLSLYELPTLTPGGLTRLFKMAPNLREINFGFIRNLNDNILLNIAENCQNLTSIDMINAYTENIDHETMLTVVKICTKLQIIHMKILKNWNLNSLSELFSSNSNLHSVYLSKNSIPTENISLFVAVNNLVSQNKRIKCIEFENYSLTQSFGNININNSSGFNGTYMSDNNSTIKCVIKLTIEDAHEMLSDLLIHIANSFSTQFIDLQIYCSRISNNTNNIPHTCDNIMAQNYLFDYVLKICTGFPKLICLTLDSLLFYHSDKDIKEKINNTIALLTEHSPLLTELDVTQVTNCITDNTIKTIVSGCKNLVSISFDYATEITDESLIFIAANRPTMKNATFKNSESITTLGWCELLHNCTQLLSLTLDLTNYNDITPLIDTFLNNKNDWKLTYLNISNSALLTDAMLSEMLAKCPYLVTIELRHLPQITKVFLKSCVKYCTLLETIRWITYEDIQVTTEDVVDFISRMGIQFDYIYAQVSKVNYNTSAVQEALFNRTR